MRKFRLLFFAAAVCCLAQSPFYLKDGDRVLFYGDSITDQRLYTTFTESFVVTRFPTLSVAFVHSGWGGDRVTGGGGGPIDLRLERDVFAYKPTVMTIMLGMNDGSYRKYDETIANTFQTGYRHIIAAVKEKAPGARITAILPSPFDDVTRPPTFGTGYNAVLVRYGDFLKDLAQKEKIDTADLNGPVVAMLQKANETDATTALKIIPDRVHPGAAGHLIMAAALLKAWNAPAVVSDVEIDGAAGKVVRSDNAEVKDLNSLSWTQVDGALPMPLDLKDAVLKLAVQSSDFLDTLDRQMLKVTGLTAARYRLAIDGQTVGTFDKDELAAGVNLAMRDTPMLRQANDVHALTLKRTGIHQVRWRTIQVPMADQPLPHKQAAMDALDALDADLAAAQRDAAQPKPRRFELMAAE